MGMLNELDAKNEQSLEEKCKGYVTVQCSWLQNSLEDKLKFLQADSYCDTFLDILQDWKLHNLTSFRLTSCFTLKKKSRVLRSTLPFSARSETLAELSSLIVFLESQNSKSV